MEDLVNQGIKTFDNLTLTSYKEFNALPDKTSFKNFADFNSFRIEIKNSTEIQKLLNDRLIDDKTLQILWHNSRELRETNALSFSKYTNSYTINNTGIDTPFLERV